MAKIQVIFAGAPRTMIHDTYDFPVVLQFGDKKRFEDAFWVIPSHPGRIPTRRLSEIRVNSGSLDVLIDGPEGFRSGPHHTDWVRSYYPRGKQCALLLTDSQSKEMHGVTIAVADDTLFVDDLPSSQDAPTSSGS